MIDKDTCELLFQKYHGQVYDFCFKYLKDVHAAEDCTQEVFMVMLKKKSKINLSKNILSWLYETSKKICKKYISKNSIKFDNIDDYAEVISDPHATVEKNLLDEVYDILSKEDADLLFEYINADHNERKKIAERLGIKNTALYQKIKRLRNKILDYLAKWQLHIPYPICINIQSWNFMRWI